MQDVLIVLAKDEVEVSFLPEDNLYLAVNRTIEDDGVHDDEIKASGSTIAEALGNLVELLPDRYMNLKISL